MHARYLVLLEIDIGATQDDVKAAYRKLVKKVHPDMGGTRDKFLELQQAYEWLAANHSPSKPSPHPKDIAGYEKLFRIFETPPPWGCTIPIQYAHASNGLILVCMYESCEFRVVFAPGTTFPKTINISNVHGRSAVMYVGLGRE